MAKILEDNPEKATGNTKKDTINQADFEYTQRNIFINGTVLVAAISIYATFAFITIQYLRK